jgi:hypothetical protein
VNYQKAPFPWFGGKADASPYVWAALGDVPHYIEPFAGSLAVLLHRPHPANRPYYSETIADIDALVTNFWRSIQLKPQETAEAASYPVSELDKHARGCFLLNWRQSEATARLAGDPRFCDPVIAGWWAWCVSCSIGAWGVGGPWWPDENGILRKRSRGTGVDGKRPHISNNGQGVNHAGAREPGVDGKRPHLSDSGQGINRQTTREIGVIGNRPEIVDNGRGVNHAGTRETGVLGNLPHLTDSGKGVNRPQSREPGVKGDLPHISKTGQGVNHASMREPGVVGRLPEVNSDGRGVNHPRTRELGVAGDLPHFTSNGQGVNHASMREPGVIGSSTDPQDDVETAIANDYEETGGYHPMTMPEVRRWFAFLSARLRHVRIINGDWSGAINGSYERLLTSGASLTLPVRQGKGPCGVFLDPPYGIDDRDISLYGENDSLQVAARVREWCLEHGDDPRYRIVYAGFDQEGEALVAAGWREVEWFRGGFLKGGMGNLKGNKVDGPGHQQHRERLWLSPHCLTASEPDEPEQPTLEL